MGSICRLLDERFVSKRSTLREPAQWFIDWIHGGEDGESSSGVRVTPDSALKHTPFWAAVQEISGTISSLPFIVYERLKTGGKKRYQSHPAYELLHNRANDYVDAVTFIETRQAHVLTYGNGYGEIQRNGRGQPVALWPLLPNKTWRRLKDGIFYYEVRTPDGQSVYLPDYNVLHVKGLGFDGYTGYNVVQYHKEAIGYGKAVREFAARFFANGANVGGVLEHPGPGPLGDKALDHLKESLKLEYGGLSQAHRLMILEEGMKWSKTGVDPEQAQALEIQKFTVDDCARIFNLPPHKIASMEHSKYNNIEQENIDYVIRLLRWFRKWEAECNYKLFLPSERQNLFCEILIDALLRGDTSARYQAYNIGRTAGFLCVDDIRERENMNPLPDGKGQIFLEPLNMKPAGTTMLPGARQTAEARAHRQWMASQWRRIIIKQVKALAEGTNGDWHERHRKYARLLLAEPVSAYAEAAGIEGQRAQEILSSIINEQICKERTLEPIHAERLAERIIAQIGGDYAVSE